MDNDILGGSQLSSSIMFNQLHPDSNKLNNQENEIDIRASGNNDDNLKNSLQDSINNNMSNSLNDSIKKSMNDSNNNNQRSVNNNIKKSKFSKSSEISNNPENRYPQYKCYGCNLYLTSTPTIFSCRHHLCSHCLSRQILLAKFNSFLHFESKITIKCTCGHGTLSIPINEWYKKISKLPEQRNNLCRVHSKVYKEYCLDCRMWLCEACLNDFHKKYFPNHRKSNTEPLKSHCFYHKDKIKTCICKECNELICDECIIDQSNPHYNHQAYNIQDYQKVVKNKKKDLKYKEYDDIKKFIKNKKKSIINQRKENIENYEKCIKKGIEKLQELQKKCDKMKRENEQNMKLLFKIFRKVYKHFYSELNKEDKLNLSLFEFLQKMPNQLLDISYNSLDFPKFDQKIENLEKSFKNVFDIKLNFSTLNYDKITSFNSCSPLTALCYINKNDTYVTGHQDGMLCVYKNSSILEEPHLEIKGHSHLIYTIKELTSQSQGDFISTSFGGEVKIWSFDTSLSNGKHIYNQLVSCYSSTNALSNTNIFNDIEDTNKNNKSDYEVICLLSIPEEKEKEEKEKEEKEKEEKKKEEKEKEEKKKEEKEKEEKEEKEKGKQDKKHTKNKENKKDPPSPSPSNIIDIIELEDKRLLLSGSDNIIRIFSIPQSNEDILKNNQYDPNKIIEIKEGVNYEKCLCKINNNTIASGSVDHRIKIWDIQKQSIKKFLVGHTSYVNTLLLTKKEEQLLSGGGDGLIIVWDIKENDKLYQYGHKILRGHQSVVQSMIKINENKIISCSNDKSIRVWDLIDLNCVYCMNNSHTSVIYGLAVTNDYKLISVGNDSKINFYDVQCEKDNNDRDNVISQNEDDNYNTNEFINEENNDGNYE